MDPVDFIKVIRESFDGSVYVYTKGSCYRFYEILKCMYPEAEPYYGNNHVITKVCDKFYDITGEVPYRGEELYTGSTDTTKFSNPFVKSMRGDGSSFNVIYLSNHKKIKPCRAGFSGCWMEVVDTPQVVED